MSNKNRENEEFLLDNESIICANYFHCIILLMNIIFIVNFYEVEYILDQYNRIKYFNL